jgi:hypothetical protein
MVIISRSKVIAILIWLYLFHHSGSHRVSDRKSDASSCGVQCYETLLWSATTYCKYSKMNKHPYHNFPSAPRAMEDLIQKSIYLKYMKQSISDNTSMASHQKANTMESWHRAHNIATCQTRLSYYLYLNREPQTCEAVLSEWPFIT